MRAASDLCQGHLHGPWEQKPVEWIRERVGGGGVVSAQTLLRTQPGPVVAGRAAGSGPGPCVGLTALRDAGGSCRKRGRDVTPGP